MQQLKSKRAAHLALSLLAIAVFVLVASSNALAESGEPVCESPSEGYVACQSISAETGYEAEIGYEGTGERGGYSPLDLRSAYVIPETGGSEQTVAIVDAYNDPNAESDLKIYRAHYKLPECTEKNGCFKKVSQTGGTTYPMASSHWSVEISLDLDMVSAVCPSCHIMLVEATSNTFTNMDAAENEAATLGATEISDSWDGIEHSEETSEDKYFKHPSIPITVAAGDYGYGVRYPAASPYVISVGGTNLIKTKSTKGWSEKVWGGTGSGCSAYESKPAWQTDPGCSRRTDNDVAAVASPETPVSVYDSYETSGWILVGGTSVSSPIVAGVEAHATAKTRAMGAEAFYKKPSSLFDVTSGSNGSCATKYAYLCTAEAGYDGPTGWGTPDGVPAVSEWSLVEMPNPKASKGTYLWGGVSCSSAEACMAAGHYNNSEGNQLTLAERWDGKTWTIQETPNHQAKYASELGGISCASSEACIAVGEDFPIGGPSVSTFAEQWNGKEWSIQETPNPPETERRRLTSVSCTSSTSCTAIGEYWGGKYYETPFAEKWNGKVWGIQEIAKPGNYETAIRRISCSSTGACTAVGLYEKKPLSEHTTLAERWNGKEWSIQTTPNPTEAESSSFEDVSCPTAISCTAVGYYNNSKKELPFIEAWSGKGWSIQTVQVPNEAKASWLHGVSCTSSEACTAVGGYFKEGHFGVLSLIETWNGKAWTIQAAPSPGPWGSGADGGMGPSGVSCTAIETCTTVGYFSESEQNVPFSAMD